MAALEDEILKGKGELVDVEDADDPGPGSSTYVVSSLNYCSFLGTQSKRGRLRLRTPKGTIFHRSDHVSHVQPKSTRALNA